jgi:hypothetical protein
MPHQHMDPLGRPPEPPLAGPHHGHHELQPHGHSHLGALDMLLRERHITTLAEALQVLAALPASSEVVAYLQLAEHAGLPLDLVVAKTRKWLEYQSYCKVARICAACQDQPAALVLPLPHAVIDLFRHLPRLAWLHPGGGPLPHDLRLAPHQLCTDPRQCRKALAGVQLLVCEAAVDERGYFAAPFVLDLIEAAQNGTEIAIHLRPRVHEDDERLDPEVASRLTTLL